MSETLRASQEKIGGLLRSYFFNIPLNQRRYAWDVGNVQALFNDLIEDFNRSEETGEEGDYLLGQILVYKGEDDRYDVTDGQQRLTTLIIMFCAIRDYLGDLGEEADTIQNLVHPRVVTREGVKINKTRITLGYPVGKEFIDCLIHGRPIENTSTGAHRETFINLTNAYSLFRTKRDGKDDEPGELEEEFGTDIARINRFLHYLENNVSVVLYVLGGVVHSYKIYETLNSRGKGLDSSDLIKNMIFSRIDPSRYDIVDLRWNHLLDKFNQKDLIEFLTEYALARFPRDEIREDWLFSFFSEKDVLAKYDNDMINLLNDMLACSEVYTRMSKRYQSPQGIEDTGILRRINMLGNKRRIKSHFSLLLATYLHHPGAWPKILGAVETVILIDRIVKARNHEGLRVFPKWRKAIIEAKEPGEECAEGEKTIDDVLADIAEYIKGSMNLVDQQLKTSLDGMNRMVRKYILSKIYFYIENQAYEAPVISFDSLMSKEIEEEHCLPQNPDDAVLQEFGIDREKLPEYVWQLGNLLLLEKSNNRTCSNKGFREKSRLYRNSPFLANRIMVDDLYQDSNNRIARSIKHMGAFTTWNPNNLKQRSDLYRKILIQALQE